MHEVEFDTKVLEIEMVQKYVGYAKVQCDPDEGLFHMGEVMETVSRHVKELGWDLDQLEWSSVIPQGFGGNVHVYFYTQQWLDKDAE